MSPANTLLATVTSAAAAVPVPVYAHIAASAVFYLLLVYIGKWLRNRTGVHLGWVYQIFALATAVYLPTVYPHYSPRLIH